jgi:hypothetical protein
MDSAATPSRSKLDVDDGAVFARFDAIEERLNKITEHLDKLSENLSTLLDCTQSAS